MNTFLLPVYEAGEVYIMPIKARTMLEAEDKVVNYFVETYDLDVPADLNDLLPLLNDIDIVLGELSNVEEF